MHYTPLSPFLTHLKSVSSAGVIKKGYGKNLKGRDVNKENGESEYDDNRNGKTKKWMQKEMYTKGYHRRI